MSPYIAYEIFKRQRNGDRGQHGQYGTRSTIRFSKLMVRRLNRRIRHAVNAVAHPDDTRGAEKNLRNPA